MTVGSMPCFSVSTRDYWNDDASFNEAHRSLVESFRNFRADDESSSFFGTDSTNKRKAATCASSAAPTKKTKPLNT